MTSMRRLQSFNRSDSSLPPDTWDSKVDKFAVIRQQKEKLEWIEENYNAKKHFEVIDDIFTTENQKAKLDAAARCFLRRYKIQDPSMMRVETLMEELRKRIVTRENSLAQQGFFFRKNSSTDRPCAIVARENTKKSAALERKSQRKKEDSEAALETYRKIEAEKEKKRKRMRIVALIKERIKNSILKTTAAHNS